MTTQPAWRFPSILVVLAFCMALQMTGLAMFLPLFALRFDSFGAGVKAPSVSDKEKDMKTNRMPSSEKAFACETCPTRKKAEANPRTLIARLWRWHTGWRPGWKAYRAHPAKQAKP